ncbi:MAG TPA: thymidylate synthase, partial [Ktedonobacterales bacterium]|nr:thymidylate synthase [Ktedonobacterales bacterium]
WVSVAGRILAEGMPARYDGLPIVELAHVVLDVAVPDPDDAIIAAYGNSERLAWMQANFGDHAPVAALGNAESYATRLYDYGHSGRDQIAWVIERLRHDPASRSATITTLQPLTDTAYIPCASLLDFWLPDGALELVVYAHSIDFGTKGYGNLVELAAVQRRVASALEAPVGRLVMIVKSAHVYDTERDEMAAILAAQGTR